jgi:hypothetical protein
MKSTAVSRRRALGGIATLAAGVVAGTTRPSTAVAANACGGLTREEFLEYVTLFNANDPRFIRYHRSMTMSPTGWEQQTSRLPSAGLSSGSGP